MCHISSCTTNQDMLSLASQQIKGKFLFVSTYTRSWAVMIIQCEDCDGKLPQLNVHHSTWSELRLPLTCDMCCLELCVAMMRYLITGNILSMYFLMSSCSLLTFNHCSSFSLPNRTSRLGQLVSCDFCPLVFHLDCLDPPLTTPPAAAWMCPLHPHHRTVRNLNHTSSRIL